ncbi:MAG: hypothetical protein PHU34_12150 [Candidatus Methanoperedens sp.]|nr:hypothetical protein [Candidatus Methanoperedens sp.]
MENTEKMRAEKVSVCSQCYEYVTLKQEIFEGNENPVVWTPYCPRCKTTVVNPKLMDIAERQFLNVRAMRKAKEM